MVLLDIRRYLCFVAELLVFSVMCEYLVEVLKDLYRIAITSTSVIEQEMSCLLI
jgi:hypothetical protein